MTTSKLKKTAYQHDHDVEVRVARQTATFRRILVVMLAVMVVMALCIGPAFASGGNGIDDIEQGIKMGLKEVYKLLTVIVGPVAVVCLGFAAYQVFFNGSKGMEVAKKVVIYTVLGVAIAYLAPVIVNTFTGWFENSGDQGIFD